MYIFSLSRNLLTPWPALAQSPSHLATLHPSPGSPKLLLRQLPGSLGLYWKSHTHLLKTPYFLLCSPNDIDRVRMLIRDLTIKALIPWVEKQLKHLHEVVTNRKSRCDLESDSWSYKPLTAQGGHCPMVVVIHCRQWKLLVNHLSLHPCHWNCQILGAFSPEPNDGLEQTKEVQVGALVWCTAERRLNCRWD